jgi:hypothetical protein
MIDDVNLGRLGNHAHVGLIRIAPHHRWIAVFLAGVIVLFPWAVLWAQDSGLSPLPIMLPKPMFEGTPENVKIANLEKPRGNRPREPFLAPAGVTNVALHKPVTSTDKEPVVGDLEMITNGDKSGSDGSYVELGPALQSVTIDLQARNEIFAILVWHYHKQARVYFDVIVQVADDPDFIVNVQTAFNNDNDNTAGLGAGKDLNYFDTYEGKLIDAKGVQGRYVRLYSNGNNVNDLNHYVEVEVWGRPVK